jgi:putative oxidoreductase
MGMRSCFGDRPCLNSGHDGGPAPHCMAWLTNLTELPGGLAVLRGHSFRWRVIPMAAVLLVAMFTVPWQYGFSSIKLQAITPAEEKFGPPGYKCDLLCLACLVALLLLESGPLAVDRLWPGRPL